MFMQFLFGSYALVILVLHTFYFSLTCFLFRLNALIFWLHFQPIQYNQSTERQRLISQQLVLY